jgi:hypothetical protein
VRREDRAQPRPGVVSVEFWENALSGLSPELQEEFRHPGPAPEMLVIELPRGGWVAEGEPKPVTEAIVRRVPAW